MWQQLLDAIRQVMYLTRTVDEHTAQIAALRTDVENLTKPLSILPIKCMVKAKTSGTSAKRWP